MPDVDKEIIKRLDNRMDRLVETLKHSSVEILDTHKCKVSQGIEMGAFWVPNVEVADGEAMIKVYSDYYELWMISDDGWEPVLITPNLSKIYDRLIHS